MKLFVCVAAALAVIQTVTCRGHIAFDDSDELEIRPFPHPENRFMAAKQNSENLKNFLKQYQSSSNRELKDLEEKAEKVCPGHGESFVNATMKAIICLESVDDTQETSCSLIQGHLGRCMQSPIGVLGECLPEKARNIPSLVLKMIINVSNKLCKTDGEHIFELANPCIMSRNHRTESCIRRVRARAQQYMQKIPSEQEVCEFLSSLRPCALSHVEASCGNKKTRESFMDIFDAAMLSCDSVHTNVIEDDDQTEGKYEIIEVNPDLS